ncbi:CCA tRNA nucleotidyltransferase, mitochondrial [Coemansia sp. RSA 2336]|nr:CCA tRNA nucleotidyltransferase, mitochondrial [Coemansia sp. RSA 2336]
MSLACRITKFRPSLIPALAQYTSKRKYTTVLNPSKRPRMSISLTPTEKELCGLLVKVTDYIQQLDPKQPHLTLRIAGGWVRDKLLGQESHDLDIAVDHMSGYDLAQHVNCYLQTHEQQTSHIAKISSNPERSKHLETATVRVLGQCVDFVHLRSEAYEETSRIPIVKFGTPQEDALRRDITINALFFNIHSQSIEDFTSQGLEDLRRGIVRTPMDPVQTFRDDPLRVLRVLRFASRFGFAIDEDTQRALGLDEVKRDLDAKISRERVGIEVEKMAAGPDPLLSIRLILQNGLYANVFRAPAYVQNIGPFEDASSVTQRVLQVLDNRSILQPLPLSLAVTPETRRMLILAAFMYPFSQAQVVELKRKQAAGAQVVRDSLKLAAVDGDNVSALHMKAPRFADLAHGDLQTVARNELGQAIRDAGARWVPVLLFAAAKDLHEGKKMEEVERTYGGLVQVIVEHGLQEAFREKHIVNGKEAAELLGCRPGPMIKQVLDAVMDWQLANPQGTKEECRRFILETFKAQ